MFIIKNILNKHPQLKEQLLRFNDLFFEYRQIFIGHLLRYPAYFFHALDSKVIAKPGTLNFKGGVFNPGAISTDDEILLLARSQKVPWFKARGNKRQFYLDGNPVVFILDHKTLKKKSEHVITESIVFPQNVDWAVEDFRMFRWNNEMMINHSVIVKQKIGKYMNQAAVYSGLSVLNNNHTKITFLGIPQLDFEVNNTEKNWVYKAKDSRLYLFYTISPYRVLELEEGDGLRFKTIIHQKVNKQLSDPGGFGTMVSFSTNPIVFNEKYFIAIIHQIEFKITGRCYYHWAILIDKQTLMPIKITSKPLFNGMNARGRTPGVRYISSILKEGDEILFFAGEGDVYVTATRKKINEIESLFVNLH